MKLKPSLSLILVWMTFLTLLPPTSARAVMEQDVDKPVNRSDGLRFRLSEGTEKVEASPPSPIVAAATSLSEVETRKLFARLPPIKPEEAGTVAFKLRERSLPPPRAGETIQAAFALPTTKAPAPPANINAPLEVTRFAPEGEVALAPMLSVTFSQPMVAVSSQEEAASKVPVTLVPQPQGKWRWLGTQTLIFQPETEGGRLPMATVYTLTIPAGTRSALGNALPETKSFSFATPPPTLKNSYPNGESQPRDPLMFLEFDQRIDAARVFERLKLQAAGAGVRLRLATSEEIAADESIKDVVKQAPEGRSLVVRAVGADGATRNALPPDTNVWVVITKGTPSAEGPRTTESDQNFTFKTFGALRVSDSQCGYEKRCSPFDSFNLSFSNQLDDDSFRPEQVKITPEIPEVKILHSYRAIQIEGAKRSNTTYTVTLDRSIKDTFGQTLMGDNQISFKVTTADPALFATGDGFVVLDPAGRSAFTVYSLNHPQLRVAIYKVTPDDWLQFRLYEGAQYGNSNAMPAPPGKLVSDKIIDVKSGTDELIETAIDLSPGLNDGYGQVFVRVEPVERPEDRSKPVTVYAYRQNKAEAWVQSTEIGLDAFADKDELVAWANSLKDGSPLAGVELSVATDDILGTTGADGVAHLAFKAAPKAKPDKPSSLLVARRGKDLAILPPMYYSHYYNGNESNTWRRADSRESLSWYVIDDRKLYRPGEEVNIKGWIREIDLTPRGGTEMFAPASETVNYVLKDSQNNEITKGSVNLNALAGFNLRFKLPATMNLGGATLAFKLEENGGEYSHYFQVQEFRRPEFEITARASEAPHFVGSFATATMTAAYYSGGGLADTEVDWTVTSKPTNYTPPNRDDYTFGKFYAWWRNESDEIEAKEQTFKGRTDAEGKHTLRMDFDGVIPPRPSSVTAQARVQDVNRQTFAATTTLLVHPADVYVGLKSAHSIAAASGDGVDAAEGSFPVYAPATTEAFATYGMIDKGSIAQPVKAPADAVKTFGGLEVTTASTQLQELTDAVIYLVNYPYDCSEQISSRLIGIAALKDALTAFEAKGLPSPKAMRDSVSVDIKRLQGLQNDDGGLGFWRRGDPSFPYVSIHAAHALVRAQGKGFVVPEEMLTRSQNYLREIEQNIPREYSVESKRAIQAYALYVRALMKDRDPAKARKLIADAGGVEKLSLESLGWLLSVLSGDAASTKEIEAIRRRLNNRVTETAGAAHFADSYSDGAYTILQSNRRADGVILEALIGDQPQSDLIPKLVRGLLSGRDRGHWTNTQENVFILLGLDRYFATYERVVPDFVARVWLGNDYAGDQTFKGRSIDRQQLNLPMSVLVERTASAPANLTIGKEGAGRLYFRIGTQYAPANLKLAAADYGFRVERKYEAIDDPADVRLEADGTWQIRAGARVRVRLTMSNPARRYHVALVDPLPAGLEALNPALATTEQLPEQSTEAGVNSGGRGLYDYYWFWRGTWYEHQNLRDERAEAFTSLLWEGVHEYSYLARATTPGLFVVPPTKAEEMYAPETFGRGSSDRVRVK